MVKYYKIIKVNDYTWNEYLLVSQSFGNITNNPCTSPTFLPNLHKKNKIDILCINNLTIKYKNKEINIDIVYQLEPIKKEPVIVNKGNHLVFKIIKKKLKQT